MVDRAAAGAATAAVVVAIVVALQRLLKRRTVAQSSHSACVCVCVRRLSNVKRRKQIFWQKVAVAWGAVFIPATQRGRGVL